MTPLLGTSHMGVSGLVYVPDVACIAVADLENEKGWFQFIDALARRKFFVGHAHFGSREDTHLSHDSASKLPLTLSARDAYIYAQKSPTLPRGMHIYMHT